MTVENWLQLIAGIATISSVLLFAILKHIVSTQATHTKYLADHHSRLSVVEHELKINQ